MTTLQQLEAYSSASLGLSLVIEGFFAAFATEDMPGSYSADVAPFSQWGDPATGMVASGVLEQGIKLFAPDITASTVTVRISDSNGLLASSLLCEAPTTGHTTYLTASVDAGSTATINVQSTTGFAASGIIYIGGEAIAYTGKTASSFTGITRGKYCVNATDVGATFAPAHLIGNNVVLTARTSPAVTDFPRTFYGRFCHLYLHVRDPLTQTFSKPSAATKIFTGRIFSYEDVGDGVISIQIKSALELLYKQIGSDQWHASVNAGGYLGTDNSALVCFRGAGATVYSLFKDLALSGPYSHDELAAVVNGRFRTNTWDSSWSGGGAVIAATDKWGLELIDPGDGSPARYRIRCTSSASIGNPDRILFGMHPLALALLGFVEQGSVSTSTHTGTGQRYSEVWLKRAGTDDKTFIADAPLPPIVYYYETLSTSPPATVEVTDEVNSFVTQGAADFTAWAGSNGVVQVRGGKYSAGIYAVTYMAGAPSTLTVNGSLNEKSGYFWSVEQSLRDFTAVRLGDATDPPEARQVFYYRGPAGQLLLKLLLSSGTTGHNSATYDTISTSGFGAGVPYSLVDVPSFEALDEVQVAILIAEPKPLYDYIEPILAAAGRYIIWKPHDSSSDFKLSVVKPSLESAYQSTWVLNESNKASPERTKATRAVDGLINRVVVKFGQGITGDTRNAIALTVDDIPSQTDYGRRRTVTINAGPVLNAPEVASQTLAAMLAYFSRPIATVERSFNASVFRMAPADSVTIVDNYVVDPKTGTRGATLYAWCLSTKFDLATLKGTGQFVFLPEKDVTKTGTWAPSARVDETAGGSGYSGDVTKILTIKPHEYSDSVATADPLRFNVGDKVRVVAFDAAVPTTWVDVIAARSGTTLTLTTGSGGLWDPTKRWVVHFDDFTTVGLGNQRNATFLEVGPVPYEWGHRPSVVLVRSWNYSQGMERPNNLCGVVGEPRSVHEATNLARGLNNHLAYRSRQVHLNEWLGDQTVVGTTDTLKFMQWVPFYGHHSSLGTRGLRVKVRGRQSGGGTATFTVASSSAPPNGVAFGAVTFPKGRNTAVITTTSGTNVWSAETALACAPSNDGPDGMLGTWITVMAKGSAGGISAIFNQLFVCEAALP